MDNGIDHRADGINYFTVDGFAKQMFRCEQWRASLTLDACAKRWKMAQTATGQEAEELTVEAQEVDAPCALENRARTLMRCEPQQISHASLHLAFLHCIFAISCHRHNLQPIDSTLIPSSFRVACYLLYFLRLISSNSYSSIAATAHGLE
jgi:hypothetical protein